MTKFKLKISVFKSKQDNVKGVYRTEYIIQITKVLYPEYKIISINQGEKARQYSKNRQEIEIETSQTHIPKANNS